MVLAQNTVSHTHSTKQCKCLDPYIDTYVYTYPWSTHNHTNMYTPACTYIHTYMYLYLLMCLHICTYIELSLYTTTTTTSIVSQHFKGQMCKMQKVCWTKVDVYKPSSAWIYKGIYRCKLVDSPTSLGLYAFIHLDKILFTFWYQFGPFSEALFKIIKLWQCFLSKLYKTLKKIREFSYWNNKDEDLRKNNSLNKWHFILIIIISNLEKNATIAMSKHWVRLGQYRLKENRKCKVERLCCTNL